MKKYTKLKYKVNSKTCYGRILEFKEDKILVEKCLYSDFSGHWINIWIDKSDILETIEEKNIKQLEFYW
jgi:hypothetical protein